GISAMRAGTLAAQRGAGRNSTMSITSDPRSLHHHDDPTRLVESLLEGRQVFAARSWCGDARIFEFVQIRAPRPLTPSERLVLGLVSRGAANGEAGYVLGIGSTTVSTHLAHITHRLNARVLDLVALGPLLERV